MKTVSIRIDDDLKTRWDELAETHGLDTQLLMREAIVEKLEEMEDFYVVQARTATPFQPVPNDEVWRRLGLED
jgi:RHH-type transcriptional regulator, rel operon repressor / antitoxin RelB